MITTVTHDFCYEFRGLSTDEKPTVQVGNGSIFFEMDTSHTYIFDKENVEWILKPGGGGGGTSDHSQLTNRDADDSHPVSAITGLSSKISDYDSHIADESIHVTASDKVAWDDKYTKPSDGIPASDLAEGVIPETEQANEIEVPLYTVTTAESATVTLKNYDTTVLPGTPTAVAVTLPTPSMGNDYLVRLIFKTGVSMTFSDTAPTGYAIVWDSNPSWTSGKIYEIIYHCMWIADGNGDIIISAKWSEL